MVADSAWWQMVVGAWWSMFGGGMPVRRFVVDALWSIFGCMPVARLVVGACGVIDCGALVADGSGWLVVRLAAGACGVVDCGCLVADGFGGGIPVRWFVVDAL
ncbi:hypothetical protein [Bartonella rattaustraliani]|uniref:hypothetical protein n=1 Tax=Bartonella rattaustraliani TaxID=481139 RepID=UPI000364526E|nr:hypothetical protein [Bartonella rattaustraliani]